jgi:hypothetical protein
VNPPSADCVATCITCLSITLIAAYVALEFLRSWKRRNDLWDRFQQYERDAGTRLLQTQVTVEKTAKRLDTVERRLAHYLEDTTQ